MSRPQYPPPLEKMRATTSENGRFAQFVLMNKAGQHLSFILTFEKIGLFLVSIKRVIRTMRDRVFARHAEAASVLNESLTEAASVSGVTFGQDAHTKDILLCLETEESAMFSFRLTGKAASELIDGLDQFNKPPRGQESRQAGRG